MKFIKVFANDTAYKAYRDSGSNYIKPNISLSRGSKTVFYNLDANDKPYVDLGLPSGTLWATMNVGASKPSDAGLYFQWGDTSGYTSSQIGTGSGKKKFASNWSDYKWYNGGKFTKYTTKGAILDLEDDAAHVNMGGDWHMPTPTQISELLDNTTTAWTTQGGVSGRTFTSTKDTSKSIFIPAAEKAYDGSVGSSGVEGFVWSSMLGDYDFSYGQDLYFNLDYAQIPSDDGRGGSSRSDGLFVRGVIG